MIHPLLSGLFVAKWARWPRRQWPPVTDRRGVPTRLAGLEVAAARGPARLDLDTFTAVPDIMGNPRPTVATWWWQQLSRMLTSET